MKKLHFVSGLVLTSFIILHFVNHLLALNSIETHIQFMGFARKFYQNIIIEPILLSAIWVQIYSGIRLIFQRDWKAQKGYEKLHVYSGIYLGFFLFVHTGAVLAGRFIIHIDTNFYYGAMVVNVKPFCFFYIPYYFFGVLSFFVHLGCIVRLKLIRRVGMPKANQNANRIIFGGTVVTVLILFAFTYKVTVPFEYQDLIEHYIERLWAGLFL